MAPLLLPPVKTEKFLISGLGSLVFTEEQRASCLVSVTIEKVRPTNPDGSGVVIPSYFNNKYPEPRSHWGYFHLMRRDFVSRTGPLEYRRQVLLDYDKTEVTILSRLRCLLEKEHDHRDAVDETILGALAATLPLGGEPNINELKAIWNASVESQLFPTMPETALWYQLADGWKAQLFLSWQAFPPMNCGVEYQQAPPSKVPGAGESGDGPSRESSPPPPGRVVDPLADSGSPPADSAAPPAVAEQSPPVPPNGGQGSGRYRVAINARERFRANGPTAGFSPLQDIREVDGPVVVAWDSSVAGFLSLTVNGVSVFGFPPGSIEFVVDSITATPLSPPGPAENVTVPVQPS